jgi:hypothetical protein
VTLEGCLGSIQYVYCVPSQVLEQKVCKHSQTIHFVKSKASSEKVNKMAVPKGVHPGSVLRVTKTSPGFK